MDDDPGPPYHVPISDFIRKKIEELAARAQNSRQFMRFAELLSEMHFGLTQRPLTWGDPTFHYKHLDLQALGRALDLIYVTYAVDTQRRIVYIQDIRPMTNSGLDLPG